MLKVASSASRDGRALLARLRARRLSPDFATLRDALPIVEAVLVGRCPGARPLRRATSTARRSPEKRLLVRPRREKDVDPAFASAFRLARRRLTAYHRRQLPKGFSFRDALGVAFVEKPVPHEAVGVYVPGGRAFYPSSLLMGVVPARVAGVKRIVVATPPRAFRESRELRWALAELGVDEVLLAGGAHGIAGLVSVARLHEGRRPGEPLGRGGQAPRLGPRLDRHARRPVGGPDPRVRREPTRRGSRPTSSRRPSTTPTRSASSSPTGATSPSAAAAEVARQLEGLPTAATARASLAANGFALVFPSLAGGGEGGRRLRRRARRADGARRGAVRLALRRDVGSRLRRERHADRLRRLPRRPEPRPPDGRRGAELLGPLRPRLPPLGAERRRSRPRRRGSSAPPPRRSRGSRGSRRTPARST